MKRIINTIYEIINKNRLITIVVISTIISFIINLYDLHYKLDKYSTINLYLISYIVLSIVFCTVIILISNKTKNINNKKIPVFFLVTGLILGIVYIELSPLFSGSDEHNHYYRIYEISEKTLMTPTKNNKVGSKLPNSLKQTFIEAGGVNTEVKYKNIKKMNRIKLNKKDVSQYGNNWFDTYNNTALYSPITYLPHVIGFEIGKILNLNPYTIGMLGRLFNLLSYIVLGYLSLKIIPKFKLFYLLILLSPNMLQCATTLSADAFTNIVFLLLVAYILHIHIEVKNTTLKDKLIVGTLSIVIALCKIVYLPIVLLLFINSNKKIKKEKVSFNIIVFIISVIVGLLWIRSTNSIFDIAYNQSILQKQYILHNLFSYFIIVMRTFVVNGANYIECLFVGTTMYHSQLAMPALISFIYVAIVILSMLKDENSNKINNHTKFLIAIIAIMIAGLAATAIYVQCTAQFNAIANPIITGIQGRYFIPSIMLIPFICNYKKINIKSNNLIIIALTINLVSWFYMLVQFMN